MKKRASLLIRLSFVVLLLSLILTGEAWAQAPTAQATPNTIITVNSGKDLNTSKSEICTGQADGICTLRRAIVESRNLSGAQLPVEIRFNIPATAAEGYNASLQVWEISVLSTTDASVFRRLKGQLTIDGSTQPGGRSDGPKIIVVGPGTGAKDGLIVGDVAGDDNIVIRGLGFQNFKTHMYVNTDNNLIENCWFGLASDGQGAYLRQNDPEDGSGNSGIALTAGSDNNTIRNNVFLAFDGVAAAIRGTGNTFTNNFVGTIADGSVPNKQTSASLICTTVDWLGGSGISLADEGNTVDDNIFAGLRQEISIWSNQAAAIHVGGGENHTISNNQIGVDETGAKVGVCGRGIYLADSPKGMQISNNAIVEPGMSAISMNGVLYNANTLRGNTIEKGSAWPQIDGNPKPEDAMQLGTSLPDAFENFNPAAVTSISGTAVSGTSGTSSPCPNCVVELFLDNGDNISSALQSLAVVTADASGNWSATIPAALTSGQGIRTTSTTAQFNTIPNMQAGTTTGLSELYTASGGPDDPGDPGNGDLSVYLPLMLR